MLKAMEKWHEEKLANGTMDLMYNFIQRGGFAIHNYGLAEDAFANLTEYPGFFLYDWDVVPMVDNKQIMSKAMSRMEKNTELEKRAGS